MSHAKGPNEIEYDGRKRLIIAACHSYNKHCGEFSTECAEADLLGEALAALKDLWADDCGAPKSCGCAYTCVHVGGKVRAVLAKLEGKCDS